MTAHQAPLIEKQLQGDYVSATWPGKNESGLKPFGKYVLVRMDEFASKHAGVIDLPEQYVEKMNFQSETGCIYAIGPSAFKVHPDGSLWKAEDRPTPGLRVYVERYAGHLAKGVDGHLYRFMDHSCIAGGLDLDYVKGLVSAGKLEQTEELANV